jgi:hypothetical protein
MHQAAGNLAPKLRSRSALITLADELLTAVVIGDRTHAPSKAPAPVLGEKPAAGQGSDEGPFRTGPVARGRSGALREQPVPSSAAALSDGTRTVSPVSARQQMPKLMGSDRGDNSA